ncbi:MAG: aldo/keto reductase [Bacteroidales bacterium]|nr:aldo/keto reductase [Bacteroidales bacterium]
MENIVLNNGVEMPLIGYGVFKVDPEECERCVRDALGTGYRMIDTAQFYANEEGVGKAIAESGIPREDIFLVTKVWLTNSGEERAAASIEESLRKLRTDYVDLLLVHQPYGDYYGTYRALESALASGKTRAIGLSNFYRDRYVDLVHHTDIVPAVDQLETNVFCQQTLMRSLLAENGTQIMAWGPMAQGKNNFFTHEVLTAIGEKYGKTASQTGLRFLVQQGIPVIPKSTGIARMEENLNILDFTLSDEDMSIIRGLNLNDCGTRDYTSHEYASKIISQVF